MKALNYAIDREKQRIPTEKLKILVVDGITKSNQLSDPRHAKSTAFENVLLSDPPITSDKQKLALLLDEAEKKGFESGVAFTREEYTNERVSERNLVSAAISGFEEASRSLRRQCESEVAQLSVAIARKILKQEAQIDPLFLSDAVQSAVGSLHEGAQVVLSVSPADITGWQKLISSSSRSSVSIQADDSIQPGMCVCSSGKSKLDLSIDVQVGEISRKFLEMFSFQEATQKESR